MKKKRESAKICPEILKSLAAQLGTLSAEDLWTLLVSHLSGWGCIPLSSTHRIQL